jgi:hypothetical protein
VAIAVGDKVTATWGNSVRIRHLKKAATESVTSSVTLQDDNDFVLTLSANTVYRVTLSVATTGATGGDLRAAWAVTGTVTSPTGRFVVGPESGTTSSASTLVRSTGALTLTTNIVYGTDGSSNTGVREEFIADAGVSGGTLKFQWAQGASSATATTVLANSFLTLEVVESL